LPRSKSALSQNLSPERRKEFAKETKVRIDSQ